MIPHFTLEMPHGIFFGPAERKVLPDLLRTIYKRIALVRGSTWFEQSGRRREFLGLLKNFMVEEIICVSGEPTTESVQDIVTQVQSYKPDIIIAIGGGSVIDSAKAAAGLAVADQAVEKYLAGASGTLSINRPGIPLIAVPTTSGTGAEVTKNAVIKSSKLGLKRSIRSPFLLARYAIIDSELTLDIPLSITGMTGLDALTQLLEAFVSRKAKPIPRAMVLSAFPKLIDALKVLSHDPGNLEARTKAAYGSLASGIALTNSGLGAAHGFASAIGGFFDIPHGLICSVFLAPVLEINADVVRNDLAILLERVKDSPEDPVLWIIKQLELIRTSYGLPKNLKSYSIDRSMISEIVRRSSGSSMSGNPKDIPGNMKEELVARLI